MKKTWIILPSISFILSIIGIWHALPMHVVGDEEALIGGALKMIELKTLIPSLHPADFASLYYPPLISYLILIVITPIVLVKWVLLGFSVSGLQDYFALNQNGIWIAARLLSALFAAGTVAVVYHIAKRMFSEKIAWLSSVFLITSFFHVVVSHWVRHWTFTTFFVYATILSSIVIPDLIRNPETNNQNKKDSVFSFFFSFLDSRFRGNDGRERSWFILFLPGILGGLGFGISYIGSLGFFVGITYIWFKRKDVLRQAQDDKMSGRVIWGNVVVFAVFSLIFTLLNIQEVYRMISPIDGSLSDPKTFTGLIGTMRDIGMILIRQEIALVVLASLGIVLGTRYRTMAGFIAVWLVVYAALIYGAFHLELRYVYLMIPAFCLLVGLFFESVWNTVSARWVKIVFVCLVFVWPAVSVARYEQLLLTHDTREQAVEWIQENIQPNEPFVMSSETMIVPRTNDAIEKDQAMGRVRASERYKLMEHGTWNIEQEKIPFKPPFVSGEEKGGGDEFQYYNMHFWLDDLGQGEIDQFIQQTQPIYFIVDYWAEDKLNDREQRLIQRGTLVQRFQQSTMNTNYDINGNFSAFNDILFMLDRFGPIVEVYRL